MSNLLATRHKDQQLLKCCAVSVCTLMPKRHIRQYVIYHLRDNLNWIIPYLLQGDNADLQFPPITSRQINQHPFPLLTDQLKKVIFQKLYFRRPQGRLNSLYNERSQTLQIAYRARIKSNSINHYCTVFGLC